MAGRPAIQLCRRVRPWRHHRGEVEDFAGRGLDFWRVDETVASDPEGVIRESGAWLPDAQDRRNSSGSLAILTAMRRASSEVSSLADDAERMLSTVCRDDTLQKQRRAYRATWHVDVYVGILQGVTIGEIELKQETQELILPRWIGKEVTGDSFYKKINMRACALKGSSPGAPRAPRHQPAL
jgi:hypothetical protein